MINDPDFIHAAALDDLREKEVIVISGEDRPIAIFWNGGNSLLPKTGHLHYIYHHFLGMAIRKLFSPPNPIDSNRGHSTVELHFLQNEKNDTD